MHYRQALPASVMTESMEQRYCIRFCQKLGNNQTETIQKIQQALSQTQIKEWFNCFKTGQTSMESEVPSGRPSTSRNEDVIEKVRQIVMKNRPLTPDSCVEVLHEYAPEGQTIIRVLLGDFTSPS